MISEKLLSYYSFKDYYLNARKRLGGNKDSRLVVANSILIVEAI